MPQGRAPRRALDIRAQAPAPEVVTIRPREVPEFSRTLLAPAIYRSQPVSDLNSRTIVIFPGALPILAPRAAGAPAPPDPEPTPPQSSRIFSRIPEIP